MTPDERQRRMREIFNMGLGPVETIRLILGEKLGSGSSTEERRELFAKTTLDEIRQGIDALKNQPASE